MKIGLVNNNEELMKMLKEMLGDDLNKYDIYKYGIYDDNKNLMNHTGCKCDLHNPTGCDCEDTEEDLMDKLLIEDDELFDEASKEYDEITTDLMHFVHRIQRSWYREMKDDFGAVLEVLNKHTHGKEDYILIKYLEDRINLCNYYDKPLKEIKDENLLDYYRELVNDYLEVDLIDE